MEIISDKGRRPYILIGYIEDANSPLVWEEDGAYSERTIRNKECAFDLVQTGELWVNIYPRVVRDNSYESRAEADRWASPDRIACIKVTYTPGQFDEE